MVMRSSRPDSSRLLHRAKWSHLSGTVWEISHFVFNDSLSKVVPLLHLFYPVNCYDTLCPTALFPKGTPASKGGVS